MLSGVDLGKILFLDIETVPEHKEYDLLEPKVQLLFEEKTQYLRKDELSAEEYYHRAGIWAEFGKIVCISVGYFAQVDPREFRTTSFTGKEPELLQAFCNLIKSHFSTKDHLLCAHNGKEFDFPYIARRLLIHQLEIPEMLQLYGKKPWEVRHLDTLQLWKFGDYKNYTSLKLLTQVLNIPSPKDDIDGSQVRQVYYEEQDIDRISRYCEKDVVAIAQIVLRMKYEPILTDAEIISR